MIDMNKLVDPADQPTQAPQAPYQDVGGGQNIIQPMPGQGQPMAPAPGQNLGIGQNQIMAAPSPVDNLYKWADYGMGTRPPAWTDYGDYQQQWNQMGANTYRDPSWPGHMVWNPYWGFMNYGEIMNQLEGGYTGGIQDMPGFSRLGEKWWEEYTPQDIYGSGVTEWPSSQGGGGGGDYSGTDFPWGDWMNFGGTADVPGQYWSEPWQAPTSTGFQYPSQWDMASDTLAGFAQGMPMTIPKSWRQAAGLGQEGIQTGFQQSAPWAWTQAQQMSGDIADTGMRSAAPWAWTRSQELANQMAKQEGKSVGQDPWYEQAKAVAQTDIEDAIKEAAEQAGLSGLRWSTPMGRSAQDIAGRTMGRVGLEWTGRELDALEQARQREQQAVNQLMGIGQGIAGLDEAAKARQMQAIQNLMGIGEGVAGLGESARNRQMQYGNMLMGVGQGISGLESQSMDRALQAAGMLPQLGQMYLNAPQDWAQQMFNMGQGMYGQTQGAYDRAYQDFLRMAPEQNPWLSQAFGLAGLPSNMVPQQYQQSFMSQLFGGLSSLIPGIGLMKMFGGG